MKSLSKFLLGSMICLSFTWAPAQTLAETSAPGASPSLGERALEDVHTLAEDLGIRPAGTDAETQAADFLADRYRSMGYAVDETPFTWSNGRQTGTSRNVVASDPNEDPDAPLVIIGGHYDSVPQGPGANDNGSGTATVLEVARELSVHPVSGVAVRYVAFGAEEVGLFGSRVYATGLSDADRNRLQVAMSLDMLAVGDQPAFDGNEPWVTSALALAHSQGYDPVRLPASYHHQSDHGPFMDAELPAIMFHWLDDPCWHEPCDVADRVQPEAMDLMGSIAIELVRIAAS
ncbi:MAG TPA: M28 family peptidase [Chloroflexota bacterium]